LAVAVCLLPLEKQEAWAEMIGVVKVSINRRLHSSSAIKIETFEFLKRAGGDNPVYVIDTDTGAMLSKRGASDWEIESTGFSNTVAAVRKRYDQQQKAREALANWLTATKETFPKLSHEEKLKAATNVLVAKCREQKSDGNDRRLPVRFGSSWIVTEYLKKDSDDTRGGYEVPKVNDPLTWIPCDPKGGTKEGVTVVCFEVRRDETRNLILCIPTTPLKLESSGEWYVVLDASPTIVEDLKEVLAKKE